jgi:hypothetical protein
MFSFDPYSWLFNFGLNTVQGKDPLTSAKNATIGQGFSNLLGNIIPSDLFPTEVAGNTVTQASQNLPQAMISQDTLNQGILNTMGDASSIGGANLMSAAPLNTIMPTPEVYAATQNVGPQFGIENVVDKPFRQFGTSPYDTFETVAPTSPFKTQNIAPAYAQQLDKTTLPPLQNPVDQFAQIDATKTFRPDFNNVVKPSVQDSYATKVAETNKPLYERAYESMRDYVKENPLETAMLGLYGGSTLYEGIKGREKPVPMQTVSAGIKQATAPQFGSPLKIRRPA